jgi:replication-associated recombination protein RarA
MHAYLVTGYNPEKIEFQIKKLVGELGSRRIDFELAKIADVRELINFIKLHLNQQTIIVAQNLDRATLPAQNAFLKALEEPQKNLKFILAAKTKESLVPTIVSRCQLIELRGKTKINKATCQKSQKFFKAPIGKKLALTSKIRNRQEAIDFVNELILGGHALMLKNPNLAHLLETANQTLVNLHNNGNVQLQLTNFVVNTT